ncbi:AAA family ATPase [Tritonibacter mobilis]|uniref:AAA family ATPase n=1 Tax=Tritonibacter mobilis TaxID=379347 RepID=UPI001401CB46|nr:hypothetical protein [Tritonibacter mobilis]NHM20558.1 hypothetical protein [Tritonibacter mobilis]NHM24720.1 hypothetical protein [Tritonibacter mobilis]
MNRPMLTAASPISDRKLEAFVSSEEGKNAVDQLVHKSGTRSAASIHSGTLATAARMVGIAKFGDVVIAELGEEPHENSLEAIREIANEGVQLILLGRQDDIATYRTLIAAGARDYLVLPLAETIDFPGLPQPQPTIATEAPARNSRVIAVCGVSGGTGASLLSSNLAVALMKKTGSDNTETRLADVALLDADLGFGTVAIDLDIEQTQGLLDALAAPERIDSTFLTSTMAEPLRGLRVYSAETSDMKDISHSEAGLPELLRHLRRECPNTVIDLPRKLMAENSPLLDEVDDVVFVMSPGFGSVRACGRLIDLLKNRRTPPRLWAVLSRTRRDAGLKPSEITSVLNCPISFELPYCAADLARASVKGQPLQKLAPRSAYARKVAALAKSVSASQVHAEPTRRTFFKRKGG